MKRPTDQVKEWEWIEQYWSGQLPKDEKDFFEQTMKEDARFAQEVASLREGVTILENTRMEQHVRRTLRQLRDSDRQTKLIRVRWLSFAGGLAAACIGFLLFLFLTPVSLPGYENDWEVIRDLRGEYETDSTDHFSLQRKQAFDLFFEAQALFSEGQPRLAAQRFEQVLNFPNLRPYFREAVQWHLVVCYLKTDQPIKANELYDQLKNTSAYDVNLLTRWQVGWQIWTRARFGNGASQQPNKSNSDH